MVSNSSTALTTSATGSALVGVLPPGARILEPQRTLTASEPSQVWVDVLGIANPTASVTVNGNTANRHGEYFHSPLSVANSSAAYPTVTVASTYGGGTSSSGKVFVPPATETFTHDQDGNLTADGRWAYT